MNYFIAGYLVVWAATFVYIFSLQRRQKEVADGLQKLLNEKTTSQVPTS